MYVIEAYYNVTLQAEQVTNVLEKGDYSAPLPQVLIDRGQA